MILVVLGIVVLAVICGLVVRAMMPGITIARLRRPSRRPRELRGDWWSEFERQLRAYERRNALRSEGPRHPQDR